VAPSDDVLLATVRDFAERCGALRVAALIDRGPDRLAPVVEAEPGEPVTISIGDENLIVPTADLAAVAPLEVDVPKPLPATALDVDPISGQLEAPIGAIDALARAVAALAGALGGRSVAHIDLATRSRTPLSLAARAGEAVVVTVGDQQFELPVDR
jgi:hypothetical protein